MSARHDAVQYITVSRRADVPVRKTSNFWNRPHAQKGPCQPPPSTKKKKKNIYIKKEPLKTNQICKEESNSIKKRRKGGRERKGLKRLDGWMARR